MVCSPDICRFSIGFALALATVVDFYSIDYFVCSGLNDVRYEAAKSFELYIDK